MNDGYVLFGTLIDNNNSIAFNGAISTEKHSSPDRMGKFLKAVTRNWIGGWKVGGMMVVALSTIKALKSEFTIKEIQVPDDFTQVGWVYVLYYKLQNPSGLKVRVFHKGQLFYDSLIADMPITKDGFIFQGSDDDASISQETIFKKTIF